MMRSLGAEVSRQLIGAYHPAHGARHIRCRRFFPFVATCKAPENVTVYNNATEYLAIWWRMTRKHVPLYIADFRRL